jgi:hypothetical protein
MVRTGISTMNTLAYRNGHLFEPMTRLTYRRGGKVFVPPAIQKLHDLGFENERRFRQLANKIIESGKIPGLIKVKKTSTAEDERRKIDFRLFVETDGVRWTIPFQIKSSNPGAAQFEIENPEIHAYIVVVNEKFDEAALTSAFRDIIDIEINRGRPAVP